jgi:hypothetical protein
LREEDSRLDQRLLAYYEISATISQKQQCTKLYYYSLYSLLCPLQVATKYRGQRETERFSIQIECRLPHCDLLTLQRVFYDPKRPVAARTKRCRVELVPPRGAVTLINAAVLASPSIHMVSQSSPFILWQRSASQEWQSISVQAGSNSISRLSSRLGAATETVSRVLLDGLVKLIMLAYV